MTSWAWLQCRDLILYIISSCLIFLYYFFNKLSVSNCVDVPIFRMLPSLLANLHKMHDFMNKNLIHGNGNFYFRGPWFSGMAIFVTCDPANVQHILCRNYQNYPKGNEFYEIFDLLGDGILNCDGESWKYQRQKMLRALSRKSFSTFTAKVTREKLDSALLLSLSEAVEHRPMIDLQDLLSKIFFDIFCTLSFGTDAGTLSTDLTKVQIMRAFDDINEAPVSRIASPKVWWKLLKLLDVGQERKNAKAGVMIDLFIAKAIERRKRDNNVGGCVSPDLLSSYLSEDDTPTSYEFLRDTVMNFLAAGRDTNTSGVSWFIWALSQNKQTEEKLLAELSSVRRDITPKGMVIFDVEELENLVYFKAALLECLRLFPPLPINFKSPLKTDVLPSGFTVTPDMKILISMYAMGRMKQIWGDDCLEFKPERWITENGTLRHEPSSKFLVFSTGPRTCLGKNMALTQMKMVAASLVYNFCFEVVEGHAVEPSLSVVLHMKNGFMLRIRKRTSI